MEAILCKCIKTSETYSLDGISRNGKKIKLSRVKTGQKKTIKTWQYELFYERI